MKSIKDFQIGDTITGFYLLKKLELKQTSSSKDYLDMIVSDKSGDIPSKLWDVTSEHLNLVAPTIVKVQGVVQSFKEKPDFKVAKIRPLNNDEIGSGITIEDFIQTAPVKSDILIRTIQEKIDSIQNQTIRNVVQYCFNKAVDKLKYYPAAKSVHHSFYSGLAYHKVRMIELAEFLCKQRPFLNRDLLVAGVILHDLGKTTELSAEIGSETTYSDKGKLLGHISIVYGWIAKCENMYGDLPEEEVMLLQHLVLSHHNRGEWGSPVRPQIAEAVALHHIDMIDAQLQAVEDALAATSENEKWTKQITAIDNNSIYKGEV